MLVTQLKAHGWNLFICCLLVILKSRCSLNRELISCVLISIRVFQNVVASVEYICLMIRSMGWPSWETGLRERALMMLRMTEGSVILVLISVSQEKGLELLHC